MGGGGGCPGVEGTFFSAVVTCTAFVRSALSRDLGPGKGGAMS